MNRKKLQDKTIIEEIKLYEKEFTAFIHQRLGIEMSKRLEDLYKTIRDACVIFKLKPIEYLREIQNSKELSPQIEYLINNITVGETYFFRDNHQIQLLQETILPTIINTKRNNNNLNIRIWSAGTSSGEEIYSTAMMLNELLPDIKRWTISLLGTDINTNSLNKAILAQFSEWSMRSIPKKYLNKYFKKENNKYTLSSEIASMVAFRFLNLNDNTFPSIFNGTNAQDLIFCRNVLIYFDTQKIKELMYRLSNSLNQGGYLMLGASDPVYIDETKLKSFDPGCAVYTIPMNIKDTDLSLDKAKNDIVESSLNNNVIEINEDNIEPSSLTSTIKDSTCDHLTKVEELLKHCDWEATLAYIRKQELLNPQGAFMLMKSKAMALANLGKLEIALNVCEEYIKKNPTDKNMYLTMALILQEMNNLYASEEALKKAIYLDYSFVFAHFQLGLLRLHQRHHESGLKSLQNALSLSQKNAIEKPVPGVSNLNYGKLSEILQNEIDLYNKSESKYG